MNTGYFSDLFNFKKKSKLKASAGLSAGKHPFFTSSNIMSKYTNNPDQFHDGSLIFGTGGSASVHYCEEPFSTSTDCFIVTSKENLSIKYVYYYLSGNLHILEEGFKGAGLKHISKKYIQNIKIPLPPLTEQQKIAEILDAADALRQKDQQLIDHYTTLSQSLFLEMFGDPVTNPMGWETINLNEICSFNKVSISPAEIVNGTKYLALESIQKKTGCIHSYQIVADGELKSNKFFFDEETILYGKLRPYLNKVALPTFKGICSTEIIPLKPIKNLTNKYFIAQVMRGKGFVLFADENSSGANLPRISPKKIEKYKIINPPITLQNQFAQHIEKIEKQKQQAQSSLVQSNNLFNSLLQKAFTGELTA